jgi:membrane protease YdiL (CAAX protease family)
VHPATVVVAEPKPPHVSATFAPVAAFGVVLSTYVSILVTRFVLQNVDLHPDWLLVVLAYVVLFGQMAGWAWGASRLLGTGSIRRDFGLHIRVDDIGWGALTFAAMMVGRVLLLLFLSSEVDDPVRDPGRSIDFKGAALAAFAVAAIVGAPIVEELVFRGVLLRGFTKLTGAPVAIVIQGLLFAAYHFVPNGQNYSDFYFGALAIFGIVAGIAAERTGRLGPSMVAHAMNNALAILVLAAT